MDKFDYDFLTLLFALVAVIVSFVALTQSKKANKLSRKANAISEASNEISKESNSIANKALAGNPIEQAKLYLPLISASLYYPPDVLNFDPMIRFVNSETGTAYITNIEGRMALEVRTLEKKAIEYPIEMVTNDKKMFEIIYHPHQFAQQMGTQLSTADLIHKLNYLKGSWFIVHYDDEQARHYKTSLEYNSDQQKFIGLPIPVK